MPFRCRIPSNSPQSFKISEAEIRYHVQAKLITKSSGVADGAKKFLGKLLGKDMCQANFDVLGGCDHELIQRESRTVQFSKAKGFTMSRTRGKLSFTGSIPSKWVGSGSSLTISLVIENESNKVCKSVKANLVRKMKVEAQNEKAIIANVSVATVVKPVDIQKKTSATVELVLDLNKGIHPNYHGKHIEIDYLLLIEGDVSGLTQNLVVELPVDVINYELLLASKNQNPQPMNQPPNAPMYSCDIPMGPAPINLNKPPIM